MKSGYTVKKLLEEFWLPSSSVFNKAIEFIPNRQSKDIEEKLGISLSKYKEKSPIEAIESLIVLSETRLDELDGIWVEAIEEATSNLPELLLLDQNESHFIAREGDSVLISTGKIFKRIGRKIHKGVNSISNAFRRMSKKPEQELEVMIREVPFKSLAKALLFELKDDISQWKHSQYRFCARTFEVAQSWVLLGKFSEEEESKITFEELISNLITAYKDEQDVYQKELESKFEEINKKLSNNLELVGTIELPAKTYDDDHIEKASANFSSSLNVSSENWSDLVGTLAKRVQLLLNLIDFKEKLEEKSVSFISKIEQFFHSTILEPHQVLKSEIERVLEELESLSNPSVHDISEIGSTIYANAKELITASISTPISEKIQQNYLSSLLDDFIENVTSLSKDQPEKSIIVEDIHLESQKPKYEIKEIEWRKFVQRMLGKKIASELDSRKIEPEEGLEDIAENYLEVLQIIETNLVMIEELSGKEEEKPIEVALKGLERSLNKIQEIEDVVLSAKDLIPKKLLSQNNEVIDELSVFLSKQDVNEMKWVETQMKVKESAGDWSTKFTAHWARFLDRFDLFRRFFVKKYRQNEETVRTFLGLKKPILNSTESTNLATFLHETDQKFEELPFIYRRLFDFHREVEANFFVQNPIFFENCRKALELWKGGFPASVSLLGEKGSGKSTLIRFLNEEVFKDSKSYTITFKRTHWEKKEIFESFTNNLKLKKADSVEELVESLKTTRKGSVVIIENLQNIYLRNMNGYEAIKSLMYIISETKEIFWVVSCSRYAWDFLNVVFNIGDYFSHSVATDKLNAEEVESLILRRQKASGYQLYFISDSPTQKSRAYKKFLDDDLASQEFLKGKYFQKLTNLAEGNATVAMILWIRSIKEFDDAQIKIESLDIINTASLDGLDSLSLFALSAFILHDTLRASELALILNDTLSNSEMMISRLSSKGLLVGEGDYYELNDLVYRQVVRLLKSRNILH